MKSRQDLQQEFITLRNAQMQRPKEHSGTRARNIYLDHLADSDKLAGMKSDDELQKAIERMSREG